MKNKTQPKIETKYWPPLPFGGVIHVTREEFYEIMKLSSRKFIENSEFEISKKICRLLGLNYKEMLFRKWNIEIVDKLQSRRIIDVK